MKRWGLKIQNILWVLLSIMRFRLLTFGPRYSVVISNLLLTTALFAQISTNEVVVSTTTPYLTWLYSPDARVTGYYVKYGTIDNTYTNIYDAYYTNLVDLSLMMPGLASGKTNFIFVTAYDALRNESGSSTILFYYLTTTNVNVAPAITAQPQSVAVNPELLT